MSSIFNVRNCAKTAMTNGYLMISFGPQNQEFSDRVKAYDIANRYRDSGCFIQNSPFGRTNDFPQRKKYLQEKWHSIKSCLEIIVTDRSSEVIDLPPKQPGCEVKILEKNTASFNGGFCFFKPQEKSDYKVDIKLNDMCLDYEGLEHLNVRVSDFQSVLNFYTAQDPSGESLDLTSLSSFPIRFSVSPNEKIFTAADNFSLHGPQFPENFFLPDTHLGQPEIESSGPGSVKIRVPLWADNTCKEICISGQCQGLCDYAQPLVGNIKLFDLSGSTPLELETTWLQGGVALPRYQGEISGRVFEVRDEFLKPGKVFRLIMTFNDPKLDFEFLRNQQRPLLGSAHQNMGPISSSGIPSIPVIREIPSTTHLPEITEIGALNFSLNLTDSFNALMEEFSSNFRFSYWPPYFKKICGARGCVSLGADYLTLTQDFKVIAFDETNNKFALKVLNLKRESTVLESYAKVNPPMPRVSCRNQNHASQTLTFEH